MVTRSANATRVIEALQGRFGARLSTNRDILERHGLNEGHHRGIPPDAVFFAETTEEVALAVTLCAAEKVPVIAFGTGTALEGHVAAVNGGLCIDLSQMNRILEVNAEDLDVLVQAGVTRKQLNTDLRDTGLFFPIDPGADASLGGMAATRASGTNAVRYGTMKENVLGLTVVMADGQIIRTGGRAKKSSAGYDLTRLFVGSEGTLGIITEVRLRLYGIPEAITAAVCSFPSIEAAANTVILTIQSGIPVARIELMNEGQLQAVVAYNKLEGFEIAPHLFYEFHGTESGAREQAERAQEIAAEFGGSGFRWASTLEERNRLWAARHDVYHATCAIRPGARVWSTDVCVPISRLAELIEATRVDLEGNGLLPLIVGHAGDGNFHLGLLYDEEGSEEYQRCKAVNDRLVDRALAMGGTCTGEHGVGMGKIAKVEKEHGPAVEVMRTIKRALDPDNIMNPGKVVRMN
ncbi:FAD-binding oxidoreductase [Geminicoccus roseus]|uniref:FAD-binding oxidoreductase n=1 Tax=Geminicoccus roseus TaxID=404900 RepID=UPI00040A4374|nr:FAD-linked oxidase C-terminal domain-containing protein [Geminicoccus roseus]